MQTTKTEHNYGRWYKGGAALKNGEISRSVWEITEGFTRAWGVWAGLCNKVQFPQVDRVRSFHTKEKLHEHSPEEGKHRAQEESPTTPRRWGNTWWHMEEVMFEGHDENSVPDPGLWKSQRCALSQRKWTELDRGYYIHFSDDKYEAQRF